MENNPVRTSTFSITQPRGNVTMGMRHAPDIDVIVAYRIEHEPRKSFE
jgi:hypothetical protein